MDPVFDAQFHTMKDAFARRGVHISVAYTPSGEVDYLYQTGRLLAANRPDSLAVLNRELPGIEPGAGAARDDLLVMSIDRLTAGHRTVPEALEHLDRRLGADNPALRPGGRPVATPDHVLHITRICPAVEPEVPAGNPTRPWPEQCQAAPPGTDVLIGVSDTGRLEGLDPARYPWLANVDGEPDRLVQSLPNGLMRIPQFAGHGTFVAGVAATMAPNAKIFVNDHFSASGGELESKIIDKLEDLLALSPAPAVINLSAGTYTRENWTSLGFESFHQRHPDVVLVAAAGNDSTDREFYPAAYTWTVSVGALGPDQQHRAWFSNYGDWVDVYALGEGMVNAYATGEYTYQEPPKRPAKQAFNGMARWDGTSFSAPLVAGLIAAEISRTGHAPDVAARDLLGAARPVEGVGRVLAPCQQP
jgi:Subtilase family